MGTGCDLSRDRHEHRNGSDARSHGHRNQTGDHKDAGNNKTSRNDRQHQIGRARGTARCAGQSAERTCHQEDEQHNHDVVITDPLCTHMYLLVERQFSVLHKGNDQRQTKSDYDGHDIEAHLSLLRLDILKINTASQI